MPSWASVSLSIPIADDIADVIEPIGVAADLVGTILQVAGGIITVVSPILALLAGGIPLPSTDTGQTGTAAAPGHAQVDGGVAEGNMGDGPPRVSTQQGGYLTP